MQSAPTPGRRPTTKTVGVLFLTATFLFLAGFILRVHVPNSSGPWQNGGAAGKGREHGARRKALANPDALQEKLQRKLENARDKLAEAERQQGESRAKWEQAERLYNETLAREAALRQELNETKAVLRQELNETEVALESKLAEAEAALLELRQRWTTAISLAAGSANASAGAGPEQVACHRMLWFTCIAQTGGTNAGLRIDDYQLLIRAALLSAREHAPSLVPVLLYSGEPSDVTTWFAENGGHVINHTISFLPKFEKVEDEVSRGELIKAQGVYLRLDIPRVVARIIQDGLIDMTNVSTTYALYTDADVMFVGGGPAAGDVSTCTVPHPQLLSIGPQFFKGNADNTGAIIFNLPAFRRELPKFMAWGQARSFIFPRDQDQEWVMDYMKDSGQPLPALPDRLDWKGYWGNYRDATILHWHGPKPTRAKCIQCFLENRGEEDWKPKCQKPGCEGIFAELVDSGYKVDGGETWEALLERFEAYTLQATGRPLAEHLADMGQRRLLFWY